MVRRRRELPRRRSNARRAVNAIGHQEHEVPVVVMVVVSKSVVLGAGTRT
jgi:hypothetical protein